MGQYELLFILNPNLSELEVRKVLEGVTELVGRVGGKVLDSESWGRRPLAYEIKSFSEGIYFVWNLELPSEGVSHLRRRLALDGSILRFLLTNR